MKNVNKVGSYGQKHLSLLLTGSTQEKFAVVLKTASVAFH
jgi:hypothetical protein